MTGWEPFRIQSDRKERVWGGTRLGHHDPPFGEAWIVCEQNQIASGPLAGQTLAEAVRCSPEDILGRHVTNTEGPVFPLLIKLLDPADWLSIQVHPDDVLARQIEGDGFRGKTEAWYVLDAAPGAELIAGVRAGIPAGDAQAAIRNGMLDPLLERHAVRAGDSLLVEAGLIHALGPGMFIYEVQQNSDLTYRVSDWGRPASAGRALHIEESVKAAKPGLRPQFSPMVKRVPNGSFRIVDCQYFQLDLVDSDGITVERDTAGRSFHAVTVISGGATLVTEGQRLELAQFESVIVPASTGIYRFEGNAPFRALVSLVP